MYKRGLPPGQLSFLGAKLSSKGYTANTSLGHTSCAPHCERTRTRILILELMWQTMAC